MAFATWCFADTWVEFAEGGTDYFAGRDPLWAVVGPVIALEAILALGLLVCWELARRKRLRNRVALHLLFLALCGAPLGIASVALLRAAPVSLTILVRARWFWPAAVLAGAAPLVWICMRPIHASRLARSVLLYSWPVLLLVLMQAVRGSLLFAHGAYADGALAGPVHTTAGRPRVVWIIFDELSQTIAFGNRAAGLALPNLDSLRAQSFYATAAESPADSTEIAMPSLILGERVLQATPAGPADLRVKVRSHSAPVSWGALPNVFDAVRDLGFNTAVVGWFHPYGRVLNRSLTKCYWTAGWLAPGIEETMGAPPLLENMWNRTRLQFNAIPLIGHLPGVDPARYEREETLRRFEFLSARASEVVSDPEIGLALIHLPIPHPPAIYDRARGAFTTEKRCYLDNLALVDREMGVLRQNMERAGLWDRTAVLVSADHGWRTGLWRGTNVWTPDDEGASHQDTMGVPFLLKLPGQAWEVAYRKPFNTMVTRLLITGILNGQIADSAAVAASIDSYRM